MLRLLRIRLLGIAFFLVVALFIWLTIAIYQKKFTSVVKVNMVTDTIGNTLPQHADVKVRGLTVGSVDSSSTEGGRVTSVLAITPAMAEKIPDNVTARLLPKTLFGERFVDLVLPAQPSAEPLRAGVVISQDSSGHAIELSRLLDDILPLLQAVPPQSLAHTLGALGQALTNRGDGLGSTIDRLNTIFANTNAVMPDLQADLHALATFANTYADAAPQLISALDSLRTTNATIIDKRPAVDALMASLTPSASRAADFFGVNRANIVDLAADSREALEYLATYSATFPCMFANFASFRPRIDAVMGAHTPNPGTRVTVELSNPRGRYLPNQDEPRWFDTRGPQCVQAPPPGVDGGQYVGGPANDGSYQPPSRRPGRQDVNMPTPDGFSVNAVYGAAMGMRPHDVPAWAAMIGAPALRGSEVRIK